MLKGRALKIAENKQEGVGCFQRHALIARDVFGVVFAEQVVNFGEFIQLVSLQVLVLVEP